MADQVILTLNAGSASLKFALFTAAIFHQSKAQKAPRIPQEASVAVALQPEHACCVLSVPAAPAKVAE